MPSMSRRNALKGFVFTLPAAWIAPVVQSVSLPAHAQTSCAVTDTIAGMEFTCEDTSTCMRFLYDLQDGCLVRSEDECVGDLPPNAFQVQFNSIDDPQLIASTVNDSREVIQNCTEPIFGDETETFSIPFLVSEVPYNVVFSIGRSESPPTVFISGIMVAPA